MALSPRRTAQLVRMSGRQLARFIGFVLRTSKVTMDPADGATSVASDHPCIVAVWHGQFMMVAALQPEGFEAEAMVARHDDAEIIAEALQPFNVKLVRGAGSQGRTFKKARGGVQALRQAVRALAQHKSLVMTADVPPGPARRAGAGIATLAKLSGRPVVPVAVATSRFITLDTWSRMAINLPYSNLACVVGEKIWVPKDVSRDGLEQKRMEIETSLNDATARAYRLVGADSLKTTPVSALAVDAPLPPTGLKLKTYRGFTTLLRPLAPLLLKMRERRGKEDAVRRGERFGISEFARPEGEVVWVHAASVGETNAVLPVIDRLVDARSDISVVLTTGTMTSASMASERLCSRALHQFVPLDSAAYVQKFLDHWRPDLTIFTESEIWPNLILETSARGIPLALVNGRMSKRSYVRWRKNRSVSLPLFSRFNVVLAQSQQMARRFNELGARCVVSVGNLKADAPAPPVDEAVLSELKRQLGNRNVFVAASTHDGEEAMIVDAHRLLRHKLPDCCAIIAPRHPERGPAISEMCKSKGFRVAQRSLGESPSPECDIYIVDTIGELGLFYALCDIAFVGGSLVDRGGQNPLEAVRLGTVVLTGPSQRNFSDTYRALLKSGAVLEVKTADDIAETVHRLTMQTGERTAMMARGEACLNELGGALPKTIELLLALLPVDEERRRAS